MQRFYVRKVSSILFDWFTSLLYFRSSLAPIACRAIILFIQHISLVRPLGEGGILRLIVDFAQIELALSPFCRRLIDLGKHYKILKAFRSLLILSPEEIANNAAVGDVVPYDIVLHHLFSRAPTEMRSPHQVRTNESTNIFINIDTIFRWWLGRLVDTFNGSMNIRISTIV